MTDMSRDKTSRIAPRQMPEPLSPDPCGIRFHSVSKQFGNSKSGVLALDDLSMTCEIHKVTCILGPSGCGKSTALQMIAGFTMPTAGEVTAGNKSVTGPNRDRVMVFQSPVLFPWLTVRANVTFALGAEATNKEDQIKEILESVELSAFADSYPYQLSGGMKQRAQIARGLVMKPDFLLMDEPFGALDALTRIQMQKLLQNLVQKYRITTVFVTHDVEESLFLGDKIYVMSARPGRIVQEIDVPWDRPRDTSILQEPAFGRLSASIFQCLGF